MQDQDLEKIFEDPVELFSYIFSNTSQNSQKYIMKTLANNIRAQRDYNIDREGMVLALQKSVREKVKIIADKENKAINTLKYNKSQDEIKALIPLPPKPKYGYLKKWLMRSKF